MTAGVTSTHAKRCVRRTQTAMHGRRRLLYEALAMTMLADTSRAHAAAPSVSYYNAPGAARDYDSLNDADGIGAQVFGIPSLRARVLARAAGDVLEVAVGTGVNLPQYQYHEDGGFVNSVVGVDASQQMLDIAAARANDIILSTTTTPSSSRPRVELIQGDVTALPFADNSFDTVVDTFGVCVFDRYVLSLSLLIRIRIRIRVPHSQALFANIHTYVLCRTHVLVRTDHRPLLKKWLVYYDQEAVFFSWSTPAAGRTHFSHATKT